MSKSLHILCFFLDNEEFSWKSSLKFKTKCIQANRTQSPKESVPSTCTYLFFIICHLSHVSVNLVIIHLDTSQNAFPFGLWLLMRWNWGRSVSYSFTPTGMLDVYNIIQTRLLPFKKMRNKNTLDVNILAGLSCCYVTNPTFARRRSIFKFWKCCVVDARTTARVFFVPYFFWLMLVQCH